MERSKDWWYNVTEFLWVSIRSHPEIPGNQCKKGYPVGWFIQSTRRKQDSSWKTWVLPFCVVFRIICVGDSEHIINNYVLIRSWNYYCRALFLYSKRRNCFFRGLVFETGLALASRRPGWLWTHHVAYNGLWLLILLPHPTSLPTTGITDVCHDAWPWGTYFLL